MHRGLEHRRAGWMPVMTVMSLALAACSPAGNGGVKIGPEDRVMRLSLLFESAPDPRPTLTATFVGYVEKKVRLDKLTWNDDQKSVNVDFLLPGLGSDPVSLMLSVDTAPPLFASELNRLPDGLITITLKRDRPKLDGAGGAGGGGAGGGDAGFDAGGAAGAGVDGGADEHPTVIGAVDSGSDANDGGPGVIECDDGGVDHGTTAAIPTCAQYCAALVTHCGPPYSDDCMNVCTGLHWDGIPIPDDSTGRNNLRCRIDQADQAVLSGPEGNTAPCAAAIWNGLDSGGCGSPCVVYCEAGRTNCPGETSFTDASVCLNTCRAFSRANLNCRVDALVRAGLGMNAAETCTLASQGSGCPL